MSIREALKDIQAMQIMSGNNRLSAVWLVIKRWRCDNTVNDIWGYDSFEKADMRKAREENEYFNVIVEQHYVR
mgnify:CR=1 FL=1